jgi:hypothetical protein
VTGAAFQMLLSFVPALTCALDLLTFHTVCVTSVGFVSVSLL